MQDFISLLERFNRKERFFLVLQAMEVRQFPLSEHFSKKLGNKVGVEMPEDAFAATDFHLDWLAASVAAYQEGLTERQFLKKTFPNYRDSAIVTGSIEDIDLLVAFKTPESYHVILVEAKGYGKWSIGQLNSKIKRLNRIFPSDSSDGLKPIVAHFCLMSPATSRPPTGEQIKDWPEWMRNGSEPYWIGLDVPADRLKVTRTNKQGRSSSQGRMFKIMRASESTQGDHSDKRFEKNKPGRLTKSGQKDRRYRENREMYR